MGLKIGLTLMKKLIFVQVFKIHVLMTVFEFVSSGVKHISLSPLTAMALMRLRPNQTIADLSYRFAMSTSTTSADILKWINIAYNRLEVMLKWPGREDLLATTPMSFRQHFKIL